jgi:fatty acid omega-hydroxylase
MFLHYTFNTYDVIFGRNVGCLAVDIPQIPFAKAFNECVEVTFYRQIMSQLIWKTLRLLKVGKERLMLDSLKHLKDFVDDLIAFKNKEIMISNGGDGGEMTYLLACFMSQYQHDELDGSHH